ncbi:MAG: tripartite tricarboxylate transporter permease, partial [Chloroflexi bacterium]|nr:tripartite tricarboxylate transporter permease [Chloroflexota bacterium]
PAIGLVALATISGVNNGLDTIPAILLGQPGGGNNVSFLEGHQLARQGKGAHTLGAVYAVSMLGGVVGALTLAAAIPIMAPFVLAFSWPEIAMLGLFGVAMVAGLSQGAMRRGMAAGLLGIMIGTVGLSPATGEIRYVFGRLELWEGIPLIPMTLGFFALPEMVDLTLTRSSVAPSGSDVSTREVLRGVKDGLKEWKIVIRQSIFGVFLGAIPGVGQATIDWLAYAFGIFWTKDKTQFGKGSLLGVIFAESAQNSKESGQAIPTLALGIPGGLSWALILVAMLQYELAPGPMMLGERADILLLMVITLSIGNMLMMIMGIGFTGQLAKLTLVPYPMVGAIIIPIVFLTGLISMRSWLFLPIMFVFMGMGLIMKKFQWPRPPMLLGIILGPVIEENMVSAVSVHGWVGLAIRPFTIALFLIAVATMYFFSRVGSKSDELTDEVEAVAGGVAVGAGRGAPDMPVGTVTLTFQQALFSIRNIPILLMVGGASAFIITALGFNPGAQLFPFATGTGIIVLSLSQLYTHLVSGRTLGKDEIMDIGMKSAGMEGAREAAYKLTGMLLLFVFLTGVIGLKWSTLSFAFLSPFLFMEGKWKIYGPMISIAAVLAFEIGMMDNFIYVVWPKASLFEWIGREIFRLG